jgi:hypothetical protein
VLEAIVAGEERLAGGRDEPVGTLRVNAPIASGALRRPDRGRSRATLSAFCGLR